MDNISGFGLGAIISQISMFIGFIVLILSSITVSNNFTLSVLGHICIIVGILLLVVTIGFLPIERISLATKIINILPIIILATPIIILISITNAQKSAFTYKLIPDIYYDYYSYIIWTICFILSLYAILISYTPDYYNLPVITFEDNKDKQSKITIIIFLILSITCYILYVNTLSYILDVYITDRIIN